MFVTAGQLFVASALSERYKSQLQRIDGFRRMYVTGTVKPNGCMSSALILCFDSSPDSSDDSGLLPPEMVHLAYTLDVKLMIVYSSTASD